MARPQENAAQQGALLDSPTEWTPVTGAASGWPSSNHQDAVPPVKHRDDGLPRVGIPIRGAGSPSNKRLQLPPNSSFRSIRGIVLAAGAASASTVGAVGRG